jgi:hypothetical protein
MEIENLHGTYRPAACNTFTHLSQHSVHNINGVINLHKEWKQPEEFAHVKMLLLTCTDNCIYCPLLMSESNLRYILL